jgi:hypothetical protein
MFSRTALAAASVPVCVGLALAAGPTYAGTTASKSLQTTTFAFRASGYGTRLIGGQIPAGSSSTGTQVIGCSDKAGRSRTNDIASAVLPGLGTAYGVRTHVWTTSRHGVVASHSTHAIASLVLAQGQLGSLSITGIKARATAFHDSSGFHATTSTQLGDITLTPAAGPPQSFPAPTPDQPVTIPGVATIYAGSHLTRDSGTGSVADAFALRIESTGSGTSLLVAHSRAQLNGGVVTGIFGGRSAATHVLTAAGDVAKSGPNPLSVMPCQGTYGKTITNSLASLDLGGQILVTGASSSERGAQDARSAHGTSRAGVTQVSLGGGTADGVTKSARGTQLGSVTVSGQQQAFPPSGVMEIPGVARLQRAVVTKTHAGISVVGLRITLLDGSGAVIDLAEAQLTIRRP